MRKAVSEVKDVEAHWCLWPPVLFWHAGLPGKMKSIYDLGLFSWHAPALQSLADTGKQEGEADWVVFMQLVGGNRQCFQRQQVVSAGVRPNSHELLSWHPENKTCSVRPGCCAKKPLLGGKAGDPGRKANQEAKLSCQLNSLGRMWQHTLPLLSTPAACVPTFIAVYAEHGWVSWPQPWAEGCCCLRATGLLQLPLCNGKAKIRWSWHPFPTGWQHPKRPAAG